MFGKKLRWEIVAFTTVIVAMIHPTGLIYLATLVVAQLIVSKRDSLNFTDSILSLILASSVILILFALLHSMARLSFQNTDGKEVPRC